MPSLFIAFNFSPFYNNNHRKMNSKAEENFLQYLTGSQQNLFLEKTVQGKYHQKVQSSEKKQKKLPLKSQSKLRNSTEDSQKCKTAISKAKEAIEKLKLKKAQENIKADVFEQTQDKKQVSVEQKTTQSFSNSTCSSSFNNVNLRKKEKEEYIFVANSNEFNNTTVFRIIKYLNQGFFGKVYLVQQVKTNIIYCIKIIPRNTIKKDQEHNLIRQIKIQSYLNHPNIIKLYSFFVDEENIYLVMEPFLREDLYTTLQKQKIGFGENEVKNIVKQVVCAVEYMHKENIIHRDLKPENILLCDNIIKICDFGWSVYSSDLRKTLCGTPLYTSPEMLKQESYNSKIDIWSIGLLTYELLMQRPPFEIKSINSLKNILTQEITYPDDKALSADTKNFINGCTKKQHRERMSIKELKEHSFLKLSKNYRCTIQ